ncbi:MAG TPA: hypothetical protein VF108_13425, partial [Actinomycetota bacterium]
MLSWVSWEFWYARNRARCDCRYRWATAVGSSQRDGHIRYGCLRCYRQLQRVNDQWPPTCVDAGGRDRD